jgi:hypothetical protein
MILIDGSASMLIWRQAVSQFLALLQRSGAFRRLNTVVVDTAECTSGHRAWNTSNTLAEYGRKRAISFRDTQIAFVITDGVSSAWRKGGVGTRLLGQWGTEGPVAVINVLPRRLWHWGNFDPMLLRLKAQTSRLSNRQLVYQLQQSNPDITDWRPSEAIVPIPILELGQPAIGSWAKMLTGASVDLPCALIELARGTDDDGATTSLNGSNQQDHSTPMPAERVRRFQSVASPAARTLAGLIAAAPLNLDLVRYLQLTMVPDSSLSDLAEVFLGGLLIRTSDEQPDTSRRAPEFEFAEGVRHELLSTVDSADIASVLRQVSEYMSAKFDQPRAQA